MIRILTLLICSTASVIPSLACDFCTPEIILVESLANCFEDRYESELAKLTETQSPVALINLSECSENDNIIRGGQAIPTGDLNFIPTTTFLLDQKSMGCLIEFINSPARNWGPTEVFSLDDHCSDVK